VTLEVNPAELRALGAEFTDLGNGLQAAVTPMTPGPDNQPSSAAVTEAAASVDHLTRVAGFRLGGYGDNFAHAATAYEQSDATSAGHIATTVRPGG
jgi:Excreted virulence factor EspC, type VII ESX diderm